VRADGAGERAEFGIGASAVARYKVPSTTYPVSRPHFYRESRNCVMVGAAPEFESKGARPGGAGLGFRPEAPGRASVMSFGSLFPCLLGAGCCRYEVAEGQVDVVFVITPIGAKGLANQRTVIGRARGFGDLEPGGAIGVLATGSVQAGVLEPAGAGPGCGEHGEERVELSAATADGGWVHTCDLHALPGGLA
jgi:hypothetical protein